MTIHYLFTIKRVIPKKKSVEREVLETAVPLTSESAERIEDALDLPYIKNTLRGFVCLKCLEEKQLKGIRGKSKTFGMRHLAVRHLKMKHGIG